MNRYNARIELIEPNHKTIISAGYMYSVNLLVTNTGNETWNAYDKNNPITLSYKIKNNNQLIEGIRTKFPYNIAPGEKIVIHGNYFIPSSLNKIEEIEIIWDLVHEGVSWFENYNSSPASFLVYNSFLKKRNLYKQENEESDIAIQCINLSKKYKIYSNAFKRLLDLISFGTKKYHSDYWVLKDINFKIRKGETFGIIGFNGSGKSTLLSILAQTKEETNGAFIVNGKVAALLELGAGFHPELTGRENVILNSHLHGISKNEMNQRLDTIKEFSGIENFFDKPVKTYSSGMFVRLAFSLAINVEPDILIIDEALAVGDEVFQRKCFKKFEEFKAKGKTIVFVSHDLNAVRTLCNKVALIFDGNLIFEGTSNEVVNFYQKMTLTANLDHVVKINNKDNQIQPVRYGNGRARISFYKLSTNNKESTIYESGKEIIIEAEVQVYDFIEDPVFGILFKTINGVELFGTNSKILNCNINSVNKGDTIKFRFKFPMHLNEGTYFLSIGITNQCNGENIVVDRLVDVTFFRVISPISCLGLINLNTGAEVEGYVE